VLKRKRVFIGVGCLIFFLTLLPLPQTNRFKSSIYSFFESPVHFSKNTAQFVLDLAYFRRNADENRFLRRKLGEQNFKEFQFDELSLENARLAKVLSLKKSLPGTVRRALVSRVIARSPSPWNKIFLIDKGQKDGVRPNMLALAGYSVIGKVIEVGPSASKVLLIMDPNSKIGVLVQRTRQTGVLYGTIAGECRVKYLSVGEALTPGDVLETAGLGSFFPKGLQVGTIEKAWKEPGQIYQVAQVKPLTDLGRIEEVILVE